MKKYRNVAYLATAIITSASPCLAKNFFKEALNTIVKPGPLLKPIAKKLSENVQTVEKGKLYRSAQLSPSRLNHYIKKYRIKTVINLRGEHHDESWWQQEAKITQEANAQFFNIAMTAKKITSKENLISLLYIYDTAPTPILVHCFSGRDRTGEAAAIWVYEKMGKGKKEALKQLSLFPNLHIESRFPAKRFLIKLWKGREWLLHEYDERNYPQFM